MRKLRDFSLLSAIALSIGCCGGEQQNAPRDRPPLTVPSAQAAESERSEAPPARAKEAPDESATNGEPGDDVQFEVQRDGGFISISARTVRDGGFSFRMSGSIQINSDGGSVHITIGDGGVP